MKHNWEFKSDKQIAADALKLRIFFTSSFIIMGILGYGIVFLGWK